MGTIAEEGSTGCSDSPPDSEEKNAPAIRDGYVELAFPSEPRMRRREEAFSLLQQRIPGLPESALSIVAITSSENPAAT